jgi:hypothetical protein
MKPDVPPETGRRTFPTKRYTPKLTTCGSQEIYRRQIIQTMAGSCFRKTKKL